jgi:hypothetical protein
MIERELSKNLDGNEKEKRRKMNWLMAERAKPNKNKYGDTGHENKGGYQD